MAELVAPLLVALDHAGYVDRNGTYTRRQQLSKDQNSLPPMLQPSVSEADCLQEP